MEYFSHTVATNGKIIIDLSPYNDLPDDYNEELHGKLTGKIFQCK